MKAAFEAMSSTPFPGLLINVSDVENMTLNEYEHWYRTQGQQLSISGYNITACSLEEELKHVQNKLDVLFSEQNMSAQFIMQLHCLMFWVVARVLLKCFGWLLGYNLKVLGGC